MLFSLGRVPRGQNRRWRIPVIAIAAPSVGFLASHASAGEVIEFQVFCLGMFSVVATELFDIAGVVSASDPNGYPILEYSFVDREINPDGGRFYYAGVEMPQGVWFTVPAAMLDLVQYKAALYGTAEESPAIKPVPSSNV